MGKIPFFVRGRIHVSNEFRDEEFVDQRIVFAEYLCQAEQIYEDYWAAAGGSAGQLPQYVPIEVEGFETLGNPS